MKRQILLFSLLFSVVVSFAQLRITGTDKETASANIVKPPSLFSLYQNYPNPFDGSTKIKFDLPSDATVTLAIYNIVGNEVAILVKEKLAAGIYEVEWNAADLPTGNYFCKLSAGEFQSVKKMVLR